MFVVFVGLGDRIIFNSPVTEVKQSSGDGVILVTEIGERYQVYFNSMQI